MYYYSVLSAGQYCVYQKGQCPKGLKSGYVFWDDDNFRNQNDRGGTLPDGKYDMNTKIYFCCKTDGDKDDPILLPSKYPFFLLAYNAAKCQMVKWAIGTVEWIYYDTEDWSNADYGVEAYPYEAGKKHPTIYYCYYRGKEIKLYMRSFNLVIALDILSHYCGEKAGITIRELHLASYGHVLLDY